MVKKVINEQAPTDVYNPSSMGQVSGEPSMGRAKSNEFDWKSHFDQIKNELDSYLNTIEGPVDVKRFQSKVMNTYYQMVSNVDDEYSYPSHGRDFQQLTTDFMSYFTNKLKELIQNYGKLTESDLVRLVKKVIKEESSKNCLLSAGFVKTNVGGPQVKRAVYQKEVKGTIYEIGIVGTDTPKKELTIIKRGTKTEMTCSSWSCDSSKSVGINFSGCKTNMINYF